MRTLRKQLKTQVWSGVSPSLWEVGSQWHISCHKLTFPCPLTPAKCLHWLSPVGSCEHGRVSCCPSRSAPGAQSGVGKRESRSSVGVQDVHHSISRKSPIKYTVWLVALYSVYVEWWSWWQGMKSPLLTKTGFGFNSIVISGVHSLNMPLLICTRSEVLYKAWKIKGQFDLDCVPGNLECGGRDKVLL